MSRPLLAAAVAAFLLAFGPPASACPACDEPPAAAPVPDPAPEAVFEASAPGALLAEEREWMLAYADGRFKLINGRLADRDAREPKTHLLTNATAWELLGRRAAERVADLRSKLKDGRLSEELRAEAVALFWLRGTLLSKEDADFLRDASRPKAKGSPDSGELKFDEKEGEEAGAGAAFTAQGAGEASAASARDADLLRNLRASLEIAPDADPRAAAAMNEALASLVGTPTGRELALEWTASGARAKLGFGPVANSETVVMNGRRILRASGGNTQTGKEPPVVTLNKDYLDTDPDFRRVNMASTLGHELFGHAFEIQRARKAGLSQQAVYYYRGDEAGSGLVGWLVQAELGGRLDNGHMWNYLSDPEKYHAGLKTNLPYYSTTLSVPEMRSPVATLEGRVASIDADRKKTVAYGASMAAWTPIIEHFISVHGIARADFSARIDDVAAAAVWTSSHLKALDAVEKQLTGTIAHWKGSGGDKIKADLLAASGSAYMRQAEERLTARADRLKGLVAGRSPEPTVPPIPGKLTWTDLNRMLEQDRKDHPGHLEKK